jgi:hypothetical protein
MADGSTVSAIGYGPVNIGTITLKDMWYVPQFKNTRLVSVCSLIRDSYSITFNEKDRAICIHKSTMTQVFQALVRNSLYTIDDTLEAYKTQDLSTLNTQKQTLPDLAILQETDSEL